MHGVIDVLPAGDMAIIPDARRVGPLSSAARLLARSRKSWRKARDAPLADDKDAIREDKARVGAMDVVLINEIRRVRVLGEIARERGHNDEVFQLGADDLDGGEKCGCRHF